MTKSRKPTKAQIQAAMQDGNPPADSPLRRHTIVVPPRKEPEQIRRTDIRSDKTQSRAKIDSDTLHDYADLMRDGVELPPLVVFYDGEFYWLGDGFHRYFAAQNLGLEFVTCEVHKGTLRDALQYSLGANVQHGLRRTNDDKRRAVEIALSDDEWGGWSDRALGALCGVSHVTVAAVRATFQVEKLSTSKNEVAGKKRVGRDGKTYTVPPRKNKAATAEAAPDPEMPGPGFEEAVANVNGVDFDPPPFIEPVRQLGEGDSLEDAQADIKDIAKRIRQLAKELRVALRCEGDEVTRPYCGCYSLVSVQHPLNQVARILMNDLPVGGTPKKPVLFHEQKAQEVVK